MQIGFFFWPYDPALTRRMAAAADRYGFDMIGIADTPGNAMDPWVAASLAAAAVRRARVALCVTNLVSRHPAVSAAAIASIDLLAEGRTVLGIGAGHSGTANLGMARSGVAELDQGVRFLKTLLASGEATLDGARARIPWIKATPRVFLAGSGARTLLLAGAAADGAFVNYGISADALAASAGLVAEGAVQAGRRPDDVEIWQIASLDCSQDAAASRATAGTILAFMAGGYIFDTPDLAGRGLPEPLHEPLRVLRRRYSTSPGAADARLLDEFGLFDYLAGRFAVWGTPADCLDQLEAARAAGLERVMFTVSLASDPARTVELFGAALQGWSGR